MVNITKKGGLTETQHDALDHTGLTGIPATTGLLDETAHDLLNHAGLTGIPEEAYSPNRTIIVDLDATEVAGKIYNTLEDAITYVNAQEGKSFYVRWLVYLRGKDTFTIDSPITVSEYTTFKSYDGPSQPASSGSIIWDMPKINIDLNTMILGSGEYAISTGEYTIFDGIMFTTSRGAAAGAAANPIEIFKTNGTTFGRTTYFLNCYLSIDLYGDLNNQNVTLIRNEHTVHFMNSYISLSTNYASNISSGITTIVHQPSSGNNGCTFFHNCFINYTRGTGNDSRMITAEKTNWIILTNNFINGETDSGKTTVYAAAGASLDIDYKYTNITQVDGDGAYSFDETPAYADGEFLVKDSHNLLDHTGLTGVPTAEVTGTWESLNNVVDASSWRNFNIENVESALVTKLIISASNSDATPVVDYDIEIYEDETYSTYAYVARGIDELSFEDRIPWEWFGGTTIYIKVINNLASSIEDLDVTINYRK